MSQQLQSYFFATFFGVTIYYTTSSSAANSPYVQFDVVPTAVALDVTDEAFKNLNPDELLIETRLQLSALMQRGRQEEVTEFFYRFEVPVGTGQIVDYLPKTTMSSNVVGHLHIENEREGHKNIGGSIGSGPPQTVLGSVTSSSDSRTKSSVKYELLPPLATVSAVGTTGRGSGAYVKLRPSKQTSLEGSKDFVLVLRVPRNWRAVTLRVVCQAIGRAKGGFANLETKFQTCGSGSFLVPLYLAGDEEAKQIAHRMANAERMLHLQANHRYHEIRRRSLPTVAHELRLIDPKIPDDWLPRVLDHLGQLEDQANSFESYLPTEIRAATKTYRMARARLAQLSVTPAGIATSQTLRHHVAKPVAEEPWPVRKNPSNNKKIKKACIKCSSNDIKNLGLTYLVILTSCSNL